MIQKGADMLGWDLDRLISETILAMQQLRKGLRTPFIRQITDYEAVLFERKQGFNGAIGKNL